jgi:hypothetical protein
MRVPAVSVLLLTALSCTAIVSAITPAKRRELRKDTKEVCYDLQYAGGTDLLAALGAWIQQLHRPRIPSGKIMSAVMLLTHQG